MSSRERGPSAGTRLTRDRRRGARARCVAEPCPHSTVTTFPPTLKSGAPRATCAAARKSSPTVAPAGPSDAVCGSESFYIAQDALGALRETLLLVGRKRIDGCDFARQRRVPDDRARTRRLRRLCEEIRMVLAEAVAKDAGELFVAIDDASAVDVERMNIVAQRLR